MCDRSCMWSFSMGSPLQLDRRAFLMGVGGTALALPVLDAMGAEAARQIPRRFCALYTANGMSLPRPENGINEWSWFPTEQKDGAFVFGKSTEPLSPFRRQLSFMSGLYHPSGPKADPHVCSDMWLTGAPLHNALVAAGPMAIFILAISWNTSRQTSGCVSRNCAAISAFTSAPTTLTAQPS